jgi:hypothetical protein
MYQTKAPLDVKRDEVHKVVHPHALPLYCRKFGIRYSFELSSWMYVLIVDDLPLSDSVVNELFDIRRDVPFSLRAILRVKIRPAEYQKSSGRYQIIEPEPTKSVYEMLPPLSASVVEFERKKTEVPKFDLDEVLANPELDAIKPVNIDPASMLADDIESLAKEGKEFINTPTLAGAASMAVVAIPGKYADKVFEKNDFFKKYEFDAPSGIKQNVYQQEIDWDLGVNTRNGIKTNLELASEGRSPFVIKDGKYSQINLHHSKQNSKGSLFELSAKTHQKYYGTNSLHPYLPNKHPTNPVDRDSFDLDREAYWIERAENEIKKR